MSGTLAGFALFGRRPVIHLAAAVVGAAAAVCGGVEILRGFIGVGIQESFARFAVEVQLQELGASLSALGLGLVAVGVWPRRRCPAPAP